MAPQSFDLKAGFRGTATGVTRATNFQRAKFTIADSKGEVIASSTFFGQGENSPMKQLVNGQPTFIFGPFDENMTFNVEIKSSKDKAGPYVPSSQVKPITTTKEPDAKLPQTFVVTMLLSEDAKDNDMNDCIVSVFQYK